MYLTAFSMHFEQTILAFGLDIPRPANRVQGGFCWVAAISISKQNQCIPVNVRQTFLYFALGYKRVVSFAYMKNLFCYSHRSIKLSHHVLVRGCTSLYTNSNLGNKFLDLGILIANLEHSWSYLSEGKNFFEKLGIYLICLI